MKLTKRGDVWIVDIYVDGRRIRKSTGETDKGKAQKIALGLASGLRTAAGECEWTLYDALMDCYDRIWVHQKSSVHVFKRIMKLQRDYPAWALARLDTLNYQEFDRLGKEMEHRGSKGTTVNRFFALISKACSEAVRLEKIERRPEFPYRKESKGKLRYITKAEEAALLNKCWDLWSYDEAGQMRSLIVVLLDSGCRLSEILKTPKIGGLDQVTLHDTKNGLSRSVPLTKRAQDALPCCPNWTANQAIGRFSRLRDACNFPDVSLHTLRHTCASRLVQAGMDLYRVKEWLGHSSITVTQRYAHLSPTHLTEGADLLAHFQD